MKKTVATSLLCTSLLLAGCSSINAPATNSTLANPSAPKVVNTFPINGAQDVDSTLSEIWVQFNTLMMDGSWSWSYSNKDQFPVLNGSPYYTENNTKNILPVKLEPSHEYDIWINTATLTNFKDKTGNSAIPFELKFKTKESSLQNDNTNKQTVSFITQINQLLSKEASIKEIDNPNLTLPLDINIGQIKKYFQIDTILFALVLRNSMNVVLSLPTNFTPSFVGVLVAKQGDTQWTKFIEIKDREETDKNNPYYLAVDNNKLLLTIVDQNGAGSGEGYMKVFALSEIGAWKLESCYYFGASYNDPSTDGDYFSFSTNFTKQKPEAKASCHNIQFITIPS